MKKVTTTSMFLLIVSLSFAQIVDIPDANFKSVLVNGLCADLDGDGALDGDVDTNNDGEIQLSEAQSVYKLSIQNENIASLEGIQSFTILENLICGINDITNLDLSQNLNLIFLECGNNQLTALDVSNNLALESLNMHNNQVTAIDVSSNTLLFSFVCYGNQLESIDVSQNPDLDFFVCYNNQITSIDVSQNLVLRHLNCYGNEISILDLSQNSNLQKLSAQENALTYLSIKNGNNLNLIRMFAQDNPELKCIEVDDETYANSQDCNFPTDSWCKDTTAMYVEDCVLGINDNQNNSSDIKIYPNPTKGNLSIILKDLADVISISGFNFNNI